MPFNHVYTCRVVMRARNITLLNTMHFRAKQTLATASVVVEEIEAGIVPWFRQIMSAYAQIIEVNATIQDAPLQDNYAKLFNGLFGGIAATPDDPRIGAWIQLRSNHTNSPYGTGGMCIGAPPQNFSQDSPLIHPDYITLLETFCANILSFYGENRLARAMEWGVFSRANYSRFPDEPSKYWFPITDARVRSVYVTRRTRRLRGV